MEPGHCHPPRLRRCRSPSRSRSRGTCCNPRRSRLESPAELSLCHLVQRHIQISEKFHLLIFIQYLERNMHTRYMVVLFLRLQFILKLRPRPFYLHSIFLLCFNDLLQFPINIQYQTSLFRNTLKRNAL